MLNRLGAGAAVAAFLLAASPASAQQTPTPSGEISRAQGEEMIRSMFAEVDVNHDGVVDAAEQKSLLDTARSQGAPDAAIAAIQRIFAEGAGADGKVTLATFTKARMTAFDKADANHDGKLSAAEQEASRAAAEKPKS